MALKLGSLGALKPLIYRSGLTQLKLWDRVGGEIGRMPCAPTILIYYFRCATTVGWALPTHFN
jgi:hypothetical protein